MADNELEGVPMQISSVNDAASYSSFKAQEEVKAQAQVSLVKKSMELTEKLMQELLQKGLQPPKNDQGSISLYA